MTNMTRFQVRRKQPFGIFKVAAPPSSLMAIVGIPRWSTGVAVATGAGRLPVSRSRCRAVSWRPVTGPVAVSEGVTLTIAAGHLGKRNTAPPWQGVAEGRNVEPERMGAPRQAQGAGRGVYSSGANGTACRVTGRSKWPANSSALREMGNNGDGHAQPDDHRVGVGVLTIGVGPGETHRSANIHTSARLLMGEVALPAHFMAGTEFISHQGLQRHPPRLGEIQRKPRRRLCGAVPYAFRAERNCGLPGRPPWRSGRDPRHRV